MLFAAAFIVIAITYVAAHASVYFFAVKFFSITELGTKVILACVLGFLAVGFFLSMILGHWVDNVFTRGYYFLCGTWVGLLVNLCLFFILAWLVVFVGTWLQSNFGLSVFPKEKTLGIIAVALAIVYSIYGMWNAFNPVVKKIDVSIDDLPQNWIGKKIVQISDVHLGHVYREGYMNEIVDKINALGPNAVMITGDLFDGTDGNLDTFAAPINRIKALDGIYFVTGNHETYLGVQKAYDIISKTKIIPLRDNLKKIDGLQLIGIDYPLRGQDRDIEKLIPQMDGYARNMPSILLIHEPLQIEAAKRLGIDLQLSGHTHKGQLFPFGFISAVLYKGYDYGFKRDGSYAIYTSSGLGGWGPPMRTEAGSEIVEITLH